MEHLASTCPCSAVVAVCLCGFLPRLGASWLRHSVPPKAQSEALRVLGRETRGAFAPCSLPFSDIHSLHTPHDLLQTSHLDHKPEEHEDARPFATQFQSFYNDHRY